MSNLHLSFVLPSFAPLPFLPSLLPSFLFPLLPFFPFPFLLPLLPPRLPAAPFLFPLLFFPSSPPFFLPSLLSPFLLAFLLLKLAGDDGKTRGGRRRRRRGPGGKGSDGYDYHAAPSTSRSFHEGENLPFYQVRQLTMCFTPLSDSNV